MMYIYLRHGDKECGRIILMLSTMALMKVGDGNLDGGHEERDIRHNEHSSFRYHISTVGKWT